MRLIKLTLATMAVYDTVRRLSPVDVPPLAARVAAIGSALAIERCASDGTLDALAATGLAVAAAAYIPSAPHEPWLDKARPLYDRLTARWRKPEPAPTPQSAPGRRIPKLPE